jgi:S-DNA-T family DNA segregation ATPase FtsK/SpoIIIE
MEEPEAARSARRPAAERSPAAARPSVASGDGAGAEKGYLIPPIDLLHEGQHTGSSITKEELLENSRTLEAKLADFGVRASVVEVHPGPVITRYELEPAPGIKVGQIANLADDLALAMRAKRIRIVAPIPGKGAVGIEIPNAEPRTVTLREVVGSAAFQESRSPLTLGLGKDTSGTAFVTTMEEMPHLLIAGATGSGKSVSMHVLITSVLLKAAPTDVRFLMIDPKMLELTVYNDIPHLMRPVVTDPREAAKGLRWVIDEMERRYKSLARAGVRNIGEFNRMLEKHAQSWGEDPAPRPLPFLVVVIDEYADLVLTLGAEVEEPIAKLAQMARAVGIHLVVATQRPSVDVITGVIKANFPSRIAFQVASKVDSRTIMDVNGAEKLLGKGDMLFLKTGKPEPDRVHGAFISNEETAAIVDFIKEQGYVAERLEIAASGDGEGSDRPFDGDSEDELFSEAVSLVVRHQLASVSMLQRRLKVGFSRAGRLMDLMERAGIVGPFEGSKAREVYVKPGELSAAARQEPDE